MTNPFQVLPPEQLPIPRFKEIFVKEYTEVNMLESPKDFFIFGSRGSGKSMLLNYMELSHQLYYSGNDLTKFRDDRKDKKYMGIMVHATRQRLDTETYETLVKNQIVEQEFAKTLCFHDFIMSILNRITKTLIETEPIVDYLRKCKQSEVRNFCKDMLSKLDSKGIHNGEFDFDSATLDPMVALKAISDIFSRERANLTVFLSDKLQSKPELYYSGNYSTFEHLQEVARSLKSLLDIPEGVFYILIDNADDMKSTMQVCVDDVVKQREHMDICFKVAIKKGTDWNFATIEEPHDYSSATIDELYSTSHTIYAQKIREIAIRRLEIAGLDSSVEKFFPKSANEEKLLANIRKELREKYLIEYEELFKSGKAKVSKADFIGNRVNKYAEAELFRRLGRNPKSYAGFNNMIHLSSGIVRQFLDLASKMVEEQVQKNAGKTLNAITLSTQNEIIKRYADEDIDRLKKKYEVLERSGIPSKIEEGKKTKLLFNLIEALGKYFKERLMNSELKEPRVFTFTLIDQGTIPEVEEVLRLGVNENYFQSYWYSTKSGVGKYPGFALNRKLCPRYVIDCTSFRGRIEICSESIRSAMRKGTMPSESILSRSSQSQKELTEFAET
jgi:hypothetical protein